MTIALMKRIEIFIGQTVQVGDAMPRHALPGRRIGQSEEGMNAEENGGRTERDDENVHGKQTEFIRV